jgi:SAM-dependent methyltransferase
MLKRGAAEAIFPRVYLEDTGFDLELTYLAKKMDFGISQESVIVDSVKPASLILLFNTCLRIFQIINWHCIPVNTQESNMSRDEFKSMYELENHHWWFVSLRGLVVDLVKSRSRSFPTILDVGSGTGGNMTALSKIGKTHGIEISRDAIELCKERGLENIVMSPVEAMQYPEESFDVVTCINVLEHVYDPVKALMEIKRVLHKDGKAIVVVPAFRMLWSQHDEALCHFRKFEKRSFLQDIEEAGLKVERVGYFFFSSFFALAPVRITKKLFSSNTKLETDTESLPPKTVNRFLIFVFRLEAWLTQRIKLPFGSSLYAVLTK